MPKSVEALPKWATLIRDLRFRSNLSQDRLGSLVGAKQSAVAKWERGEHMPSPSALMALSRVFANEPETFALMELAGLSKEFLAGTSAATPEITRVLGRVVQGDGVGATRQIPLLTDAVAAGTPRTIDEKDVERYLSLPKEWFQLSSELYGLKVKGDSMDPILLDGHIVIVDVSQRDPKKLVNEMVAAIDDGVTIKWLREDDGELLLVPNHVSVRHPVRLLMHRKRQTRIAGKVVRWLGESPAPPKGRK